MKKFFFLFLIVFSSLSISAQNEYLVYRLVGDVQHKSLGENWHSLRLHQRVHFRDSISIPQGGLVEFRELSSSNLRCSHSFGDMVVNDIVQIAKYYNQSSTKQATNAVLNDLRSHESKNDYDSYGGTSRSTLLSNLPNMEDSVFFMIKQLVYDWINHRLDVDTICSVSSYIVDDGITYTFNNFSEDVLCVNIISIDTIRNTVHLVYDKSSLADDVPYLLLSPLSDLKLDRIRFAPFDNCILISFATSFGYSVSMVETKLKHWKFNEEGEHIAQSSKIKCFVNYIE